MKNFKGISLVIFFSVILIHGTLAQVPPPTGGGSGTIWYLDSDNDGYGDSFTAGVTTATTDYSVTNNDDCDDSNPAINPTTRWYLDSDGDGYGSTSITNSIVQCFQPTNYVLDNTDCNDNDGAVHVDQTWYQDIDGDGYYGASQTACSSPGSNWSTSIGNGSDCDDTSQSLTTTCTYSSGITGTLKVARTLEYTYTASSPVTNGKWSLSGGGTIETQNSSTVTVKWTASSGSYVLSYGFDVSDDGAGSNPGDLRFLTIGDETITVYNISTPAITVTPGCDVSSITHDGNQSNVTFYWRDPGTSPFDDATRTRNVTAEGSYALRGYHSAGVWGPIVSESVTHNDPPTWYEDADGDNYYGGTSVQCTSPGANWSTSPGNGSDCDDADDDKFTFKHCNPDPMAPHSTSNFLERGSTYRITWVGVSGQNFLVWAGTEPLNGGNNVSGNYLDWTPQSTYNNLKFRVESTSGDAVFESKAISVVAPITASVDKTKYYSSQRINVSWSGGSSNESYTVLLLKGSAQKATKTVTGTSTYFDLSATPDWGNDYKVRVYQNTSNRLTGSGTDDTDNFKVYRPLRVITPNGGENYTLGTNTTITWEGENQDATYTVKVLQGSVVKKTWTNVGGTSQPWTVNFAETNYGTGYKIRVEQGAFSDESGNTFSLVRPTPGSMAFPSNDDVVQGDQDQLINWPGVTGGQFNLSYQKGTAAPQSIVSNWTKTEQGYLWDVPADLTPGSDYRIIAEQVNSINWFRSPYGTVAKKLTVTTPGKQYMGEQTTLNWDGPSGNYKVELLRDGLFHSILSSSTAGSSLNYTPLTTLDPDVDYAIRVTELNNTQQEAVSGTFIIYRRIKVTYPTVANESFAFGEAVDISWHGEDETALYDVHILKEGAIVKTWNNVAGPSLDPDWIVTKSETDLGSNYKIRVVQGAHLDESDHAFTIDFPASQVMDPADGSIIAVGQSIPLTWSGNVLSDYYFFLNGTLQSTVSGTSDTWVVPAITGENNQLRLEATDGLSVNESGTFEIAPQLAISAVGPIVMHGETLYLSWTGGTSNLNYQVDLINGATTINLYTGPEKSMNYLVPGDIALGTGYQIRVSQNANLETASALFEITECVLPSSVSTDQNFVKTFVARAKLGPCMAGADDPFLVQESINYMDGLGRPIQTNLRNATPVDPLGNTYDLITHFDYDDFGRQDKNYLPYPASSNTGTYQSTSLADQVAYYTNRFDNADGAQAFSQQVFEPSPLNRVSKAAAPGDTWKASGAHTVDTDYLLNDGSDSIRFMIAEGDSIVDYGTYLAGELTVTRTSDENNGDNEGIVYSYINRKGQNILKKVRLAGTTYAKTVYIYDDYGNLRHVIQPEGVRLIEDNTNTINWNSINAESFRKSWMFSYQYDNKQRMIAKRVPGADWQRLVHDQRDRVVMTQDGNMNLDEFVTDDIELDGTQNPLDSSYVVYGARVKLKNGFHFATDGSTRFHAKANPGIESGGWIFTKYDELNRPVMTGRISRIADRSTLVDEAQTHYDSTINYGESYGAGPLFGYSNQTYPTEADSAVALTQDNLLTVTYYDTYDFTGAAIPAGARSQVKGMVTGTRTRVLETNTWLTSITYYDDRYRALMTVTDNYLGGKDTVKMTYRNDISPLVSMTETIHTGGEDVNILEQFTYDHMDRLLTTTHSINGGTPVVIASNTYNEIGELVQKDLGDDNDPVQSVDYAYNIRGWLTSINDGVSYDPSDDKFGMALNYEDAPAGFEQYNGNIGQMSWRSQGGGLQNTAQDYVYHYDASNRLLSADYSGTGNFDVSGISYDHNGNIKTLQRNTRDNLTYEYGLGTGQSNRLLSVSDAATSELFEDGNTSGDDYAYDDNGNLIHDRNKGITSIHYNHLNLPQLVTFQNGNTVAYTYDAVGMKLRKVSNEGSNITTTDYLGGMHFINNALTFLQHSEGRAVKDGSSFNYEYNLTDHLGNVRVSVSQAGTVVQRDGYYPFGLSFNHWNQSIQGGGENFYKYNGFEEQMQTGWFDYLARYYDPEIGRFMSIDPAADLMRRQGPYNYAFNNPVRFIDPDGMMPEDQVEPSSTATIKTHSTTVSEDADGVQQVTSLTTVETWNKNVDENGNSTYTRTTETSKVTNTIRAVRQEDGSVKWEVQKGEVTTTSRTDQIDEEGNVIEKGAVYPNTTTQEEFKDWYGPNSLDYLEQGSKLVAEMSNKYNKKWTANVVDLIVAGQKAGLSLPEWVIGNASNYIGFSGEPVGKKASGLGVSLVQYEDVSSNGNRPITIYHHNQFTGIHYNRSQFRILNVFQ